jgi:hypothetical protein
VGCAAEVGQVWQKISAHVSGVEGLGEPPILSGLSGLCAQLWYIDETASSAERIAVSLRVIKLENLRSCGRE